MWWRPSVGFMVAPMRLEAQLILWVTALLSLGATLFHGTFNNAQLSSEVSELEELNIEAHDGAVDSSSAKNLHLFPRRFVEVDQSVRSLFEVEIPAFSAETVVPAIISEPELPVLKGVVSSAQGLRAVFALGVNEGHYVVAAPGDDIGGYQIDKIEAGEVSAVSASGELATFNLRGAGEHP